MFEIVRRKFSDPAKTVLHWYLIPGGISLLAEEVITDRSGRKVMGML
jgi:hypothetical protein